MFACVSTASVGYNIKAFRGNDIRLPCHFPSSGQVEANALWFKEMGVGKRTLLNPGDESTDGNEKVEQLYSLDSDQTILLRNIVMEDAGIYHCESSSGEKLSTVDLVVEGVSFNLFDVLPRCAACVPFR